MYMVPREWMVTCAPFDLGGLGGLVWALDHCWGQLGSILGHQVASQNYGGSTVALDHVSGCQYLIYLNPG